MNSASGNQTNNLVRSLNDNNTNTNNDSNYSDLSSCGKDQLHFLYRQSSSVVVAGDETGAVSSAGMRPLFVEADSTAAATSNNNNNNNSSRYLHNLNQQQQQPNRRHNYPNHHQQSNPNYIPGYQFGSNLAPHQFDASAPPLSSTLPSLASPPPPLSPLLPPLNSPLFHCSPPSPLTPPIPTYDMSSSNQSSSSCLQYPSTSFRTTTTTSSGHHQRGSARSVVYVYELPYYVRKAICDLLDADNSWRELGGRYMGFNDTQLTLVSHALYRSASPTNELLTKWESSNAKVTHLYRFLAAMKHRRAMYHLLPYVDEKLKMLYDEFEDAQQHIDHHQQQQQQQQQYQQQQQQHMLLDSSLIAGHNRHGGVGGHHLADKIADLNLNSCSKLIDATEPISFNYRHQQHNHNLPSAILNDRQDHLLINLNNNNKRGNNNNGNSRNSDEERTLVDLDNAKKENANDNKNGNVNNNKNLADKNDNKLQMARAQDQKIDVLVRIEDFEIPYKELVISTDDFCKDNILGSGGFGTVYIGEWKGTKVAVKKLKGVDNLSQALTELRILNCCRIDNILPLYAVSLDGPEPCLVYQYMPNGSLEDRLLCKNATPPLSWLQRSKIAEGVARALNFLHTLKGNPFVHGDVKSANILLDPLFEPKLGDFGLARQVVKDSRNVNSLYTHCTVSSVNGTSVYLPAEYLRHKILSPAVDVYSYGIVVLEMATGKRAYDGKKLLINLVEDEYSRALQQNVTAQNRVQSPHQQHRLNPQQQQQQQQQLHHSSEQNSKMENIHQGLMDKRIGHLMGDDRHWFNCLLELGRKCAHKTKSKRPIMIQILEYFNQCKTTDRIHKLCDHAIQNRHPLSKINFSKSNIKSPLELQLWYDFVRKSCGTLSEAVFENFGAQVTRMIEDIKFTFSNESAFHLDFLLNSVPNSSGTASNSSGSSDKQFSGELNNNPIIQPQQSIQQSGTSSSNNNNNNNGQSLSSEQRSNQNSESSNFSTRSSNYDSGTSTTTNVDDTADNSVDHNLSLTNDSSANSCPATVDGDETSGTNYSAGNNRLNHRMATGCESGELPNYIPGSLPVNIDSYLNHAHNNHNNNNNSPNIDSSLLIHSHSTPSTTISSLLLAPSSSSLSLTSSNQSLSALSTSCSSPSSTSIPFIPLLTALGFNPSDIDDVLLKK